MIIGPIYYIDELFVPDAGDITGDIHSRYYCRDFDDGIDYVNKKLEIFKENVDEENLVAAEWLPDVRTLVAVAIIEDKEKDSYVCYRYEMKTGAIHIDIGLEELDTL